MSRYTFIFASAAHLASITEPHVPQQDREAGGKEIVTMNQFERWAAYGMGRSHYLSKILNGMEKRLTMYWQVPVVLRWLWL